MSEAAGRRRGLPDRVHMRHDAHFVEDLSERQEDPVGRMVLLNEIQIDASQPRSALGDLSELVRSIQDKGVLEPILVRPNPDQKQSERSGAYRIISGERRYRAAKEAGLVEIPVIVMEVDDNQALEIALVENLQRKDLTPFEEGEGYHRLAEHHGYTHEEISEAVGKSRSVVTESLSLLQMPARVRDVAQELGVSTKSSLLAILKSTDDVDTMIALLEEVASKGLTRDDLRRVARAAGKKRSTRAVRKRPYVFKFRAPDKTFNLSLSFRRSTVDRDDLIQALESILEQVRQGEDVT